MHSRLTVGLVIVAVILAWSGFGLAPRPVAAALDCYGEPATIEVTGPGTYYGTGGRDVVAGDVGVGFPSATIYTFGGDDVVCVSNYAAVYAGSGRDVVFTSSGSCVWEIHGGSGDDYLGCAGTIWGDSGNDVIENWGGSSYGGAGNDRINDQFGLGYCDGGSGIDTVTCQTVVNAP
jgi:hypothetical protein